jgi:hypothetical protein
MGKLLRTQSYSTTWRLQESLPAAPLWELLTMQSIKSLDEMTPI